MTWPFFTIELKSALSSWTMPETWVPTVTVVTACSVPVAPTASMMEPRDVCSVVTVGSLRAGWRRRPPARAGDGQDDDEPNELFHIGCCFCLESAAAADGGATPRVPTVWTVSKFTSAFR